MELSEIVEVNKTNSFGANFLLEHGYKLLHMDIESESRYHPEPPDHKGARMYYVQRSLRFVVGRTADVAHADIPRRQYPASVDE